jgi:hypothetical protein
MLESTKRMPGVPPASESSARPPLPSNMTRVELDTSHFIRREQFDRYMALVEPFLRAHAGTRAERN